MGLSKNIYFFGILYDNINIQSQRHRLAAPVKPQPPTGFLLYVGPFPFYLRRKRFLTLFRTSKPVRPGSLSGWAMVLKILVSISLNCSRRISLYQASRWLISNCFCHFVGPLTLVEVAQIYCGASSRHFFISPTAMLRTDHYYIIPTAAIYKWKPTLPASWQLF